MLTTVTTSLLLRRRALNGFLRVNLIDLGMGLFAYVAVPERVRYPFGSCVVNTVNHDNQIAGNRIGNYVPSPGRDATVFWILHTQLNVLPLRVYCRYTGAGALP